MSYCPPSNSKWSSKTTTDDDGWKTVSSTKAKAPPAKWGQSALKKPEPKFEDEFPTISTRPAATTANAVTATATTTQQAGQKPLTLAERMKQKLAEEEEQKRREEEERRRKTEEAEAEKNQYTDEGLVFLRSRQLKLANDFKVSPSYDQEYDEHYDEEDGYAPPHEYDDDRYDNHDNHYDNNYNNRYEDDRYNNFDDY
jgi:hypothetical protein